MLLFQTNTSIYYYRIYVMVPTLVDADYLPGPPVLDEVPRSCGDVPGLEDAEVAEAGLLV